MLRKIWIVVGCALAACGGSQREIKESEPAAAHKPKSGEAPAPAAPAPVVPAPAAPRVNEASCEDFSALDAAAKATPEIEGLPYWCYQYRESMHALIACETIPPDAKASLKQGWEAINTTLRAAIPESRDAIQQACRTGVEALCPASVQAGCGVLPPRR